MKKITLISFALLGMVAAGCAGEEPETREGRRGSIGKADHTGSCHLSCGSKSQTGSCYCDDLCEQYGDCCDDYESVCEGGGDDVCGGFIGNTCDNDEFCSFDLSATCGWADATGNCETKPEACPEYFAPVCGCDGQTYDNECFANAMGTSVVSQGACAPTPAPALCLTDDACGLGTYCDHSECLSPDCPAGMACPAVCYGQCLASPPEPQPAGPTCTDSCGGPGADKSCYCDDLCTQYGDCCNDYVTVCEE